MESYLRTFVHISLPECYTTRNKNIWFHQDHVIVEHDIIAEYENDKFLFESLDACYKKITDGYTLAESLGLCEIVSSNYILNKNRYESDLNSIVSDLAELQLEDSNDSVDDLDYETDSDVDDDVDVIIKMDFYDTTLMEWITHVNSRKCEMSMKHVFETFYFNMSVLLKFMWDNNFIHTNLTTNNIGVANDGMFHLIDLCNIVSIEMNQPDTVKVIQFTNMISYLDFPLHIDGWNDCLFQLKKYIVHIPSI